MFKHRVRLRIVTKKDRPNVIQDFRARKVIVDGVSYWKLLTFKRYDPLPVPPPRAIDITNKGKLITEARYYTGTGEYEYLVDDVESKRFQPFTTNQRLSLINQIKKANSKKKATWQEHLPTIVSIAGLVIMLTLVFVFWKDITQPSLNAMSKADSITDKQLEIMKVWQEIIQKKQLISEKEIADNLPDPPPN
ncbi:hypothetical protein GF386_05325 [Candidatus Pacearchaeota archaeon]|nr:hypothetical protein [Candidatus Pacearchaeota archaeon]